MKIIKIRNLKALFIILAILFPVVGIILGIIWLTKKTKEEKALGKLIFIIAMIMVFLTCLCWFVLLFCGVIIKCIEGSCPDHYGVWPRYGIFDYWFFEWWYFTQVVSVFTVFVCYIIETVKQYMTGKVE